MDEKNFLPCPTSQDLENGEEGDLCCSTSEGPSLLSRFCLDSSLHGLKYMGQPKRYLFEKIFWLGALLVAGVCCVLVISALWNKYWDSPVVTVFQPTETSIDLIPFPAITICNVNNVRKSRSYQYIDRARTPNLSFQERLKAYGDVYDLNHICEASTTFAQRFNVSAKSVLDEKLIEEVLRYRSQLPPSDPVSVLRKATQNCPELIKLCLWLDEEQDCNTFFTGVETDYGFCCIFNVVPLTLLLKHRNDSRDSAEVVKDWDKVLKKNRHNILHAAVEGNHHNQLLPNKPFRQVYHGRSSGLSVLLDPDLEEYFCRNTDADGFVIGASNSLDFPRVRDHGIAVRPNSETFMSIKPDLTVADPSIYAFSLDKRQCYISDEFTLKYYAYYTESNCVDECIANHTFEMCSCIQYYMPRSLDQPLCSPDQFECTERVRKDVIQRGLIKECNKCLPTCNDVSYQVETTFLEMHEGTFLADNFPGLNKSLNNRNVSIVHLYMGVDSSYPRLRKELYSFIDLISATGGLLGLCLGFSMLSVLEICYFSTIRVCIRIYKRYQRRNKNGGLALSKPLSKTIILSKPRFLSEQLWKTMIGSGTANNEALLWANKIKTTNNVNNDNKKRNNTSNQSSHHFTIPILSTSTGTPADNHLFPSNNSTTITSNISDSDRAQTRIVDGFLLMN